MAIEFCIPGGGVLFERDQTIQHYSRLTCIVQVSRFPCFPCPWSFPGGLTRAVPTGGTWRRPNDRMVTEPRSAVLLHQSRFALERTKTRFHGPHRKMFSHAHLSASLVECCLCLCECPEWSSARDHQTSIHEAWASAQDQCNRAPGPNLIQAPGRSQFSRNSIIHAAVPDEYRSRSMLRLISASMELHLGRSPRFSRDLFE